MTMHRRLEASPPGVARTAPPAPAGTVMLTDTGSARVGLLENGGRGRAATRSRDGGPGHATSAGETVETWVVGGREATNRAGAEEYLGLAANTVAEYARPFGRRTYGWPEPLPERVDGQEVFALDDLAAFAATRVANTRTPPAPAEADADQLVGVAEFAAIKGVNRDTFKRYVEDSVTAWERGEDGYLPRPEWPPQPAPVRGFVYRWPYATAVAWTFPPARRTGGRKPGPRPQVTDLRQVLAEAGPGERPTVRELAATLTDRLGTDVSSQTVRRLLRQLRDQDAAAN